ncbi:F-box/kelch-repeat protein [Carex littledalei]|uniref:F-box/kelch-repeat protein n=1 Tax=Carex littledalei TaxID=544730 RepID=A0A833QL64_9POAL|nr:F-box/kelch-repeat protein [Carex littledalei]
MEEIQEKVKEEEEATEIERNWADLPPELFSVILNKFSEISDFVRSRAVCKSWRFSSSVSDLPPQFPWIFELSNGPDLEFYSIAFNQVYTLHVPCPTAMRFFGPAGGYLLTGEEDTAGSFSLLNPLNNIEVPLPVVLFCVPYKFALNFSSHSHLSSQIDNYMLFSEYERSVGCKLGDDRWDIIGPGHECKYRCYYFKGLFFRVEDSTGVTTVMDISSRKELYVIQPPKYEHMSKMSFAGPYLVESCGEILNVCYNQSYKRKNYKFYIYRLEFGNGEGNPCWVKLTSIGDRILFFDFSYGNGHGFYLKASDFVGFKGNCIYFINVVIRAFDQSYNYLIVMYDMENGETVFIDSPFGRFKEITWFMPTINHI